MEADFLSPIALSTRQFALGVDGDVQAARPGEIINPNRSAMLVDEIKISCGEGVYINPAENMNSIELRFSLGSIPLTNDFIPMRSFMPMYLSYAADLMGVWHLARPMYVPPDVQLNLEVRRRLPFAGWSGLINTTAAVWNFTVLGRSMPSGMQIPSMMYVPWACATSCYGTAVPFMSGDAEIGNPFDEPLNVDYMTGFNITDGAVTTPPDITFQATLSNSKVLARDPIPFGALFPPDRPQLKMRALLQPKEFVSVVLDLPQPTAVYPNIIFTTVGMTGWRELQTPLGALP